MRKLIPQSTIERYFSLHYAPGLARQIMPKPATAKLAEDVCIARHHNGICVVCLSPRHPVVVNQKKLSTLDYRVELRQVRGKRKKGGIVVESNTKLCSITCETGEVYSIQCAVKGTIVEYNDALDDDISLISRKPLTDGYLAVILPWPKQIKTAADNLLSQTDYNNSSEAPGDSHTSSLHHV